MGGCMGCHGVAQALGTDFSFALLFGQQGAGAEAANADQPLGPLSFGNDVSIQSKLPVGSLASFLGIGPNNVVGLTAGRAQQWVLINPRNSGSLASLTNGSVVAVRSLPLGSYLLATNALEYQSPPPNPTRFYKVALSPTFGDTAAQWTIRTVAPVTGPLKPGDTFCLMNNKPGVGNKTVFLSRSPTSFKAVVVDYCTSTPYTPQYWQLQAPFSS
jgi:hypothetical protein